MRYIWLTDIHLDFLKTSKVVEFLLELKAHNSDGLFLTGDISNGQKLVRHLQWIQKITNKPVYFTLGNHDYYASSFKKVEKELAKLHNPNLHYLDVINPISLSEDTALVGETGWCHSSSIFHKLVYFSDWFFIKEFRKCSSNKDRFTLAYNLAKAASERAKIKLQTALQSHSLVYFLTHWPPWPPQDTGLMADFWRPYYRSEVMAEMLLDVMKEFPDKKLVILAGHEHTRRDMHAASNLKMMVGESDLRKPRMQDFLIEI